jgi:hypothetical protein
MLASVLLALSLGQACPEPPSRNGPPPCAAANVPGCLPGYRASRDESGRRVYVCDPAYGRRAEAPPPQGYAQPQAQPPQYAQPQAPAEPPRYAPAPTYQPPPPPAWRPSPYEEVPVHRERRGQLAFVFLPGLSSATGLPDSASNPVHLNGERSDSIGALALEIRGQHGGARLRFAGQWTSFGRIADVTLKYDLLDDGPLRPFLGVGVGAATVDPETDWRACASIVGGVDLYLSRNVFLTAELQGRRFSRRASAAGGLETTDVKQTAALFGLGIYLERRRPRPGSPGRGRRNRGRTGA